MATVSIYEQVLAAFSTCDDCGAAIKVAVVIEWRSYKRELCHRCAEDIRRQLGNIWHAKQTPRRKRSGA